MDRNTNEITAEVEIGVAPLAGAWIEMSKMYTCEQVAEVAPLAGAWIEIWKLRTDWLPRYGSLPLRERG